MPTANAAMISSAASNKFIKFSGSVKISHIFKITSTTVGTSSGSACAIPIPSATIISRPVCKIVGSCSRSPVDIVVIASTNAGISVGKAS